MSFEKFKDIFNKVLTLIAETSQDTGLNFTGEDVSKIAIAIYLQEARETKVNNDNQAESSKECKEAQKSKNVSKSKKKATKKQIRALKKIYGSLDKVRELAGVDTLYDLTIEQASRLITAGVKD